MERSARMVVGYAWPCASEVHVHAASRPTTVSDAPGGYVNARIAEKGCRGELELGSTVHAINDARCVSGRRRGGREAKRIEIIISILNCELNIEFN